MERAALDVWLASEVKAFDFVASDFEPLERVLPYVDVRVHRSRETFLDCLGGMRRAAVWQFASDWYARAPHLSRVYTPAAGGDWVMPDPGARVAVVHGGFHGPLIAESLLGLMLHFNRKIQKLLDNARVGRWDRNLQFPGRMLRGQRVLLIGYGRIGEACARLLGAVGMQVVGCRRDTKRASPIPGVRVVGLDGLTVELGEADHVVLLLPGGDDTAGFLNRERLGRVRAGAYVYNFGRGTTVRAPDLLWALDAGILAGAGLDVTEVEPLPPDSPLWADPRVFVMPHSSCVYTEYRQLFVEELTQRLETELADARSLDESQERLPIQSGLGDDAGSG